MGEPQRWGTGGTLRAGVHPRGGAQVGEGVALSRNTGGIRSRCALRRPRGPFERRRQAGKKAGGWRAWGPTRPAPGQCQMWRNPSDRPQTGKGLLKFEVDSSGLRPRSEGPRAKAGAGHASAAHPGIPCILRLARVGDAGRWRAGHPAAVPDADARGRARVAAARRVREERPGRNADSEPACRVRSAGSSVRSVGDLGGAGLGGGCHANGCCARCLLGVCKVETSPYERQAKGDSQSPRNSTPRLQTSPQNCLGGERVEPSALTTPHKTHITHTHTLSEWGVGERGRSEL